MSGWAIPCSVVGGRRCDVYGVQLGLATLPGGAHTECHDAFGDELWAICREAGIHVTEVPRHVFNTVLSAAQLLANDGGRKPGCWCHSWRERRGRATGDRWRGGELKRTVACGFLQCLLGRPWCFGGDGS